MGSLPYKYGYAARSLRKVLITELVLNTEQVLDTTRCCSLGLH